MIILRSYGALSPARQRQWKFIRYFIPSRVRWFYEGFIPIPGQLWYADRRILYETIVRSKPESVFEVGTWYGGGSTYFITHALWENGRGILHTIEADPNVYAAAVENYRLHLPHLLPHVRFHSGKAAEVYPKILRQVGKADAVFLDGSDDPVESLTEFEIFDPYLSERSIVMMHDWDNVKMALLRPNMEKSSNWSLRRSITAPHSVGFAVWVHSSNDW